MTGLRTARSASNLALLEAARSSSQDLEPCITHIATLGSESTKIQQNEDFVEGIMGLTNDVSDISLRGKPVGGSACHTSSLMRINGVNQLLVNLYNSLHH